VRTLRRRGVDIPDTMNKGNIADRSRADGVGTSMVSAKPSLRMQASVQMSLLKSAGQSIGKTNVA